MTHRDHPHPRDPSLLSPSNYDDDASSIHGDGSESEEEAILEQGRTSADIREHDQSLLLEEEEREEMLRKNNGTDRSNVLGAPLRSMIGRAYAALPRRTDSADQEGELNEKAGEGRRERRRRRRLRRKEKRIRLQTSAKHGEDGELMYEMEEGGLKQGSSTGDSSETEGSTAPDPHGFRRAKDDKTQRRRQWWRIGVVYLFIVLGFVSLVVGAWRLSKERKASAAKKLFNNGTALFAPTTILISLDGFRADFLRRGITPRLNAFIEEGVSPVYMTPSFPSVTFPNHYTLVTGLYPESHGVVGNTFWDPELELEFYYTDPARSMQGKWWGGEPLWVTAELQGIRTAIHMWPGSEAHIMDVEPSFLDVYNGDEPLPSKVDRVLQLLDKPGQEDDNAALSEMRPQLIAAYVPNVDADGHLFGPNSTEIRTTINDVDNMLDVLFAGLEERNLTQVVNVVVVSDHGMATTSTERLIQLDDLIDISLIEHIDGWPLYGLRPKNSADLQGLYDKLASEAAANPNFDVYLRDINMPERYHFTKNVRIAPLWIVPKTGWAIVTKDEFDVQEGKADGLIYHPRGLHGYDHEHPLMRAIFVARGPAFPHAPNSRVDVFQNIEVYNIICDSLGLAPNPNNGSLRLPLQPVGLHTPETAASDPSDPVEPTVTVDPEADAISISPIEASSAADPDVVPPTMEDVDPVGEDDDQPSFSVDPVDESGDRPSIGVDPVDQVNNRPTVDDGEGSEEENAQSFWDSVLNKIEGWKDWFGKLVGGDPDKDEDD